MTKRKVLLPPTDEQLYAAELTQQHRDADTRLAREDEQEQTRLAQAGEPEARDAVSALATALHGRPVAASAEPAVEPSQRQSQSGKARRKSPAAKPVPEEATTPASRRPADAENAYDLMDLAFRKWKKGAEKDIRKANRELARDLGGDTAIYLQSGILRLSDMLDSMIKLTALAKAKEEEGDEGKNIDQELDDLRKALRGE